MNENYLIKFGGIHISKFVITDTDFDGTEDQYQEIVGVPYNFRKDEILFDTEFSDNKLHITWSDRSDRIWTYFYDNNGSTQQTTSGIPGKFTSIDLDKVDFTNEDSIYLKFYTQIAKGSELIEHPWIRVIKPANSNGMLMSSPMTAFKWKFDKLPFHSHKEVPLVKCACYEESETSDLESTSANIQTDQLTSVLATQQKILPSSYGTTNSTKSVKVSDNNKLAQIANKIDKNDININEFGVELKSEQIEDFKQNPNFDLSSFKIDKNTLPTTNVETDPLSKVGDTDARIEFRKRLNLNYDFTPLFNVNHVVPERVNEESNVLDENHTIDLNSTIVDEEQTNFSYEHDVEEPIKLTNEELNDKELVNIIDNNTSDVIVVENVVEQEILNESVEYETETEILITDNGNKFVNDWDVNVTNFGNNWFNAHWFGTYWRSDETNWIYHINLGWVFISSESFDSVWIYSETMGWMWTNSEKFTYVFSETLGEWLYLDLESKYILILYLIHGIKWVILTQYENYIVYWISKKSLESYLH